MWLHSIYSNYSLRLDQTVCFPKPAVIKSNALNSPFDIITINMTGNDISGMHKFVTMSNDCLVWEGAMRHDLEGGKVQKGGNIQFSLWSQASLETEPREDLGTEAKKKKNS